MPDIETFEVGENWQRYVYNPEMKHDSESPKNIQLVYIIL